MNFPVVSRGQLSNYGILETRSGILGTAQSKPKMPLLREIYKDKQAEIKKLRKLS